MIVFVRRHVRGLAPLGAIACFLLMAGWALALPVNGTYDEKQHIVRAYAVAGGELLPSAETTDALGRMTEAFEVPSGLLPTLASVDCAWWLPRKAASCQVWDESESTVLLPTTAARYSPVYYLPVGLVLRAVPTETGVVLARLVSAALCSAALAAALWAAAQTGGGLLVGAVVLAATPTTLNLAASINPNGLEVASGILTTTGLIALTRPRTRSLPARRRRTLLVLTGAGFLGVLTVRQAGPLLLVLILGAWLVAVGWRRASVLARRRDVRWILGSCAGAGTVVWLGWLLYSGGAQPMSPYQRAELSPAEFVYQLVTWRIPFQLTQMVAQFGYGETTVSPVVVVTWYALVGLVVGGALATAGRSERAAILGLATGSLGLLVAMDVAYVADYGWFSQGRYVLASATGVVLLASVAGRVGTWSPGPGRWHWPALVLVGLPCLLGTWALAEVMTRYQVGFDAGLDPLGADGSWSPVLGSVLPLASSVLGGLALTAVAALTMEFPPGGRPDGGSSPGAREVA